MLANSNLAWAMAMLLNVQIYMLSIFLYNVYGWYYCSTCVMEVLIIIVSTDRFMVIVKEKKGL